MPKTKKRGILEDKYATKILKAEECREYLVSIIAAILKIDKIYIMRNLRLIDTEINQSIYTKDSEVDCIVENDEMIINLEANNRNTIQSRLKNDTYIAQLILKQTYPGKRYKIKSIIQINLNDYDFYGDKKFIYHSLMMEESIQERRKDNKIDIYDVNLDLLSKMDYTDINKLNENDLKWLLYLFVCKDKNIRKKLYGKNKITGKVVEKMEEFMRKYGALFYDLEEFHKAEIDELADARALEIAEGMAKDMAENIAKDMAENIAEQKAKVIAKDNAIESAKILLKIGILSSEQIAEATKLSIDEIESLKNNE